MANYTANPNLALKDALEKSYTRVRFQQGRPVLDRELNLMADLAGPERLARNHLGKGVPTGSNGFQIVNLDLAHQDFTIRAGTCLVDGYEVVLGADVTYRAQPYKANVHPFPAGHLRVYLHVFTSEAGSAQDPALGNPGDVGAETAVRERLSWEVRIAANVMSASDVLLLGEFDMPGGNLADRRRRELTLATLCDEVSDARGTRPNLSDRLNTALNASGALKASSAGTSQIANHAVTQAKLAAHCISAAELKTTAFSASVSVPGNAETTVVIVSGRRHAWLLVSIIPGNAAAAAAVTWTEFYAAVAGGQHPSRGVVIANRLPAAITVDVSAIEIAAS